MRRKSKGVINQEERLTKNILLEAINRSGYLIESQITEILAKAGFFVESNRVIKDPLTLKSREIDLLAEYNRRCNRYRVVSRIKFIFEIKNNAYPMVLLTCYRSSPEIAIWESSREVITETDTVKLEPEDRFFERLIGNDNGGIYTQYCSLRRKKEGGKSAELMAWHPDDFHEGLVKIVQYCDEEVDSWSNKEADTFARAFLYLPVLVLSGDLYTMSVKEKGKAKLQKVSSAKLLYNYYQGEEPKIAIIYVVTKRGFLEFMNGMLEVESAIENELILKADGERIDGRTRRI